jgi:hypothetical protein
LWDCNRSRGLKSYELYADDDDEDGNEYNDDDDDDDNNNNNNVANKTAAIMRKILPSEGYAIIFSNLHTGRTK